MRKIEHTLTFHLTEIGRTALKVTLQKMDQPQQLQEFMENLLWLTLQPKQKVLLCVVVFLL